MPNTLRFEMPLLDAAQAQKHVTINEALLRADILSARRVESRNLTAPPTSPMDGAAYIVGQSAIDEWSGEDGKIALSLNGGWEFVTPWSGLTLWVGDEHRYITSVSEAWLSGNIALSEGGAGTFGGIIEIDHALAAASVSVTPTVIPDKAIVLGVTGRVTQEITGPDSWSLGVAGSPDRYGSEYGLTLGSFAHGVTGQPQAYFGASALQITANGADFSSGSVRLALHYLSISAPMTV